MYFPLSKVTSQTTAKSQNSDVSANNASEQRTSMHKRLSVLRKSVKTKPLKETINTTTMTDSGVQLCDKPIKQQKPESAFTESKKSFSRAARHSIKKIQYPMLKNVSSGYNNYLNTMKSKIAKSQSKHFETINTTPPIYKKIDSFVKSTKFLSGISVFELYNYNLQSLLKNSNDYNSLEEFISQYTNAMDKHRPDFSLFTREGRFYFENGSLKEIEEGEFLGVYNTLIDQQISQLKNHLANYQESIINDLITFKRSLNKDDTKPRDQLKSTFEVIHHDLNAIETHNSSDHPFQPVKDFHRKFREELNTHGKIKQDAFVKARIFLATYKETIRTQAPFFNSVFTFQTLVTKLLGKDKV